MIKCFIKRSILKRFVKELPIVLKKMHGKRKTYTEQQILKSIEKAGYKSSYLKYAFAIFMSKSKFIDSSLFNGDQNYYDKLRAEVAHRFFDGNIKFNIHDLLTNASISKTKMETIFDYRKVGGAEIEGSSYIINDD